MISCGLPCALGMRLIHVRAHALRLRSNQPIHNLIRIRRTNGICSQLGKCGCGSDYTIVANSGFRRGTQILYECLSADKQIAFALHRAA